MISIIFAAWTKLVCGDLLKISCYNRNISVLSSFAGKKISLKLIHYSLQYTIFTCVFFITGVRYYLGWTAWAETRPCSCADVVCVWQQ